MSSRKIRRPADDAYYVAPWSENVLQGDIFKNVPLGFLAPPDAVVMAEGERRFITGPLSETRSGPDTPKDGRWASDLLEELLEQTDQTPEALSARARELRAEAATTDIDGYRVAALALSDRYEAAAAARLTAN